MPNLPQPAYYSQPMPQSIAASPMMNPNFQQYPSPMSYNQPRSSYSNLNWVQGQSGAKAFPTGPDTKVLLLDSEAPIFYIKVTDASGMPMPLRIFDYTERIEVSHGQDDYVTRNEFNELYQAFHSMRSQQSALPESSAPAQTN